MSPQKTPPPRQRLSRPPLERMMRIHQAIQARKFPNASSLARELEVSTKSIHRDLEFMRDRLDLPLEYHASRNGYHYTQEVSSFPTLQITEGEFFALMVAEKAIEQYRGTNFEKPLLSALKKMASSLPDTISFNLADWDQTISFRTSAEPILDLEVFDTLAQATSRRQQLELCYRKPGQRQHERRIVNPYHLANINGEWFLFAYDQMRDAIRTFVPSRIRKISPTGQTFQRPKEFSIQSLLQNSFGVHSGGGHFEVIIHFDALVADYVREKKWHPSQQVKSLSGGSLELKLSLSSLGEIQRWVLSWGGSAKVIAPPALRASVRQAAREILNS